MEEIWEIEFKEYVASLLGEDEKWDEKAYAQLQESFKVGWGRCYEAHRVFEKDEIVKSIAKIQRLLPKVGPKSEAALEPGEPAVNPATLVLSTTIGCPKGTLHGGDCCGCIIGEYHKKIKGYIFHCNECGEEVGSGGFVGKET